MFRRLLIFLLKDSRRKNSHRSQLIQSLFHASAVYNSHTLGEISHGSAKIIHKGFAYLMNNGIQGNYAEFGVYEGSTTLEAYRASKLYGMKNMGFYIFDSFEGLPELSDGDGIGPFHAGQFKSGVTSFMKILKREKVEIEKFRIFEGYFENVLPQLKLPPDNFSYVYIDCDLYSSTVTVLDFLADKLKQGSIIAFDDWFCYDSPNQGERRAVAEWLLKNPNIRLVEYSNFHWAGKAFIVDFG
jgi:O-methyltransferase